MTTPLCNAMLAGTEANAATANPEAQASPAVPAELPWNTPDFASIWSEATMPPEPEVAPEPSDNQPVNTAALAAMFLAPPVRIWNFAFTDSPDSTPAGAATALSVQSEAATEETSDIQPQGASGTEALSLELTDQLQALEQPAEDGSQAQSENARTAGIRVPRPSPSPTAVEAAGQMEEKQAHHQGHSEKDFHGPVTHSTAQIPDTLKDQPATETTAVKPTTQVLEIPDDMPIQRPGEAREISLDVKGEDGSTVQVRFAADDPGHVHINIRTADEVLSQELKVHSVDLLSRLEEQGFDIRSAEASAGGETNDHRNPQHREQGREEHEQQPVYPRRSNTKFRSVFQMQGR